MRWRELSLPTMRISSLFVNAGIYTFSNLLNRAIPFLLLPVLTRFLTPQDYGIVAMFAILVSVLIPLIGVNSPGALKRKFFSNDPDLDLTRYVANSLYVVFSLFVVFGLILFVLRNYISHLLLLPSNWIFFAALIALGNIFSLIVLAVYQIKKQSIRYAIFNNSRTLTNFSLTILFVVVFLMRWRGRILGQIVTSLIFICISVAVLYRQDLFRFGKPYNPKDIKYLLRFGLPLIPHSLGNVINHAVDKLFITKLVGIADTGIYTIGYQFGAIIGLLEEAFNLAFVPWLFEKLSKGDEKDKVKIVRFTYVYFVVIICMAGLLIILSPLILRFMVATEFYGAVVYVFWIALAYAFHGMYKMVVNYIFYAEKTYYLSILTFTRVIMNIALNYFLIMKNGPIGAAQATTISFLFVFLASWFISSRVYKMPWKEGFLALFKIHNRRGSK